MSVQVLRVEVADELRGLWREPTAVFFLLAMPVGFYALFAWMWGEEAWGGLAAGTRMLATLGTFGVVGASMLHAGIGIAEDRDRGWLRAKRVTATPVWIVLAAKVAATLPAALAVLAAMSLVGALTGTVDVGPQAWLRLAVVLLAGAVPFALFGLGVGLLASSRTTTAVLNAVFVPSAVASGLWMPIEALPEALQRIAPGLPTYHLAQLGLAQLQGAAGLAHLVGIGVWALAAAVFAVVAYRHSRP